jgi:hypothetical protein
MPQCNDYGILLPAASINRTTDIINLRKMT